MQISRTTYWSRLDKQETLRTTDGIDLISLMYHIENGVITTKAGPERIRHFSAGYQRPVNGVRMRHHSENGVISQLKHCKFQADFDLLRNRVYSDPELLAESDADGALLSADSKVRHSSGRSEKSRHGSGKGRKGSRTPANGPAKTLVSETLAEVSSEVELAVTSDPHSKDYGYGVTGSGAPLESLHVDLSESKGGVPGKDEKDARLVEEDAETNDLDEGKF